jgi:protein subunit release factor B
MKHSHYFVIKTVRKSNASKKNTSNTHFSEVEISSNIDEISFDIGVTYDT